MLGHNTNKLQLIEIKLGCFLIYNNNCYYWCQWRLAIDAFSATIPNNHTDAQVLWTILYNFVSILPIHFPSCLTVVAFLLCVWIFSLNVKEKKKPGTVNTEKVNFILSSRTKSIFFELRYTLILFGIMTQFVIWSKT